jgi:hypothetical protein
LSQARHAQTAMLALLATRGVTRPIVWAPAFYAFSVLGPLLKADVALRFYPVTPALGPDLDGLRAMAHEATPHLIIMAHFYGTAVDAAAVRVFADEQGALMLEDAAHTMLPAGDIGRHGHFTCYSPRKYYDTGDGAVLVANGLELAAEFDSVASTIPSAPFARARYWTRARLDRHLPWRRLRGALPERDFDQDWSGEPRAAAQVWMSGSASRTIERLGPEGAEAIRRREIETTLAIERHVEAATHLVALPRLPDAAPYLLGFRGRDRAEAESAYVKLRRAGASAGTWPDIPRIVREHPERYGAALELRNTIVIVTPRFDRRRAPLDFIKRLPLG